MATLYDYWHLIVPEYIPMAITTLLVGAVATTGSLPDWRFWPLAFALFCIVGAFNSFNALADRAIDRINRPERPIPMGAISEKQALLFAMLLYFVALLVAYLINVYVFGVIFIAVIVTAAYSYPEIDLKRRYVVGTLTVTVFYSILCFIAGWALYPTYAIPVEIMLFLFILGFSLSITKDFMDIPGDSFNKANTLPVKHGYLQSIGIVFIVLTFAFLFLAFLIYSEKLPTKFYALLLFYPLMFFNVSSFRKHAKSFYTNHLFLKTIILIITLELVFVGLTVW